MNVILVGFVFLARMIHEKNSQDEHKSQNDWERVESALSNEEKISGITFNGRFSQWFNIICGCICENSSMLLKWTLQKSTLFFLWSPPSPMVFQVICVPAFRVRVEGTVVCFFFIVIAIMWGEIKLNFQTGEKKIPITYLQLLKCFALWTKNYDLKSGTKLSLHSS